MDVFLHLFCCRHQMCSPRSIFLLFVIIFANLFLLVNSSHSCLFNRTYELSASIVVSDSELNPENKTTLPFNRAEFTSTSFWKVEQDASPFIQESEIISSTLSINFSDYSNFSNVQVFLAIGSSGLNSQFTLTREPLMTSLKNSCLDSCDVSFDVTVFILDWLQDGEEDYAFLTWTNHNGDILDSITEPKIDATLEIVIQDHVIPTEMCHPDQYQCNDGRCIDGNHVCDAIPDCLHWDDENVCDQYPEGSLCNFEEGLCGWQTDNYWLRHSGSTPTAATGPSYDHTIKTPIGFYVYTEATAMKKEGVTQANLRSPSFPPNLADNGNCEVTFYYHMKGRGIYQLDLFAIADTDSITTSRLFRKSGQSDSEWHKEVVPISTRFVTKYYLQFEGNTVGWPKLAHMADIAIDDISMSSDCFGIDKSILISTNHRCSPNASSTITSNPSPTFSGTNTISTSPEENPANEIKRTTDIAYKYQISQKKGTRFHFTTCGKIGSSGPSQRLCDLSYRDSNISVRVLNGSQEWIVPQNGLYRIKAMGAGGGSGVENPGPSAGASAEAVVNLTAGTKIIILVGQAGHDACSERTNTFPGVDDICAGKISNEMKERFGDKTAGGGGGGGGGTFVALANPSGFSKDQMVPLVIAGGGGGLSFSPSDDSPSVNGMFSTDDNGSGFDGLHDPGVLENAGAGGGWYGNGTTGNNGQAFIFGGRGGNGCLKAQNELRWSTPGGFGGGGGGCTSGGGGGGYTGGNAALIDSRTENGKGGLSYISNLSLIIPSGSSGSNHGHGSVIIEIVIMCPDNSFIAVDLGRDACPVQPIPLWCWILILMFLLVLVFLLLVVLWCRVRRQKSDKDRLRDELVLLRRNVMTEINPLYGARKTLKEEDFPELPRECLKLLHPLGNGAFGEVYKGAYLPSPDKNESVSVAIKTLSKDATEEHKNDFLMEAVLLGSLKHPNIVQLVGVSFIRVPKFLILEFMAGGELKTFLQSNRPSFSNKTCLKMDDLLKIAMDVAQGCKYMESLLFIHRDLAARNILLTCKSPGRVAKIGDFGMAKDVYKSQYYRKSKNALVPVKWMPPESYLDGVFTNKTDVWSFGVLLWEIMTFAYIPYPGLSNHEVIHSVARGDRMCPPRYCPHPIKFLMECCWRQDPGQRPSFENICDILTRAYESQEVIATKIPSQGIEIDRGLVSAHLYDHGQECSETMPLMGPSKYPPRQHSTDSDGYLKAIFPPKHEKEKPIRVESIEEQFLKPVEMNIYDSEGPHSPLPGPDNVVSTSQVVVDHEYAFPPLTYPATNGDPERIESRV